MSANYIKKTIVLNQDYINKAIKLFNVKTERDAVDKALQTVVEENDILAMHKEIAGVGEIETVFS